MFVLWTWTIGGIVLLILGVVFYLRALRHRSVYECPSCGERFHAELMEAANCSTCGTALHRVSRGDH